MKKTNRAPRTLTPYPGRKPRPKLRFRLRVVLIIFLICILAGFLFYMFGVNLNFFQY